MASCFGLNQRTIGISFILLINLYKNLPPLLVLLPPVCPPFTKGSVSRSDGGFLSHYHYKMYPCKPVGDDLCAVPDKLPHPAYHQSLSQRTLRTVVRIFLIKPPLLIQLYHLYDL